MTNIGQRRKGILLKVQGHQEKTSHFLVATKCIGKPDGKIVWMERTHHFVQWCAIKKVRYLLRKKMLVAGNVILAQSGRAYGVMIAVFPRETPANLKTL